MFLLDIKKEKDIYSILCNCNKLTYLELIYTSINIFDCKFVLNRSKQQQHVIKARENKNWTKIIIENSVFFSGKKLKEKKDKEVDHKYPKCR